MGVARKSAGARNDGTDIERTQFRGISGSNFEMMRSYLS
jgi:hypothetical protein